MGILICMACNFNRMQSEICRVCGEPSASKHYGSYCCSGCKGFFRRTVRHRRKYTCQNQGRCEIKAAYRNCCRACRFTKCLEAKLNPLMVHGDRAPPIEPFSKQQQPFHEMYIKNEIKDEEEDSSSTSGCSEDSKFLPLVKSERAMLLEEEYEKWHTLALNLSLKMCEVNDNPLSAFRIVPEFDKTDIKSVPKYFVLVERLCDEYFDSKASHMFSPDTEYTCSLDIPTEVAFFHPRSLSHRTKLDWPGRYFLNSTKMKQMWCRIVTTYCDWVSHIPEFTQLSHSDQLRLIIDRAVPCVNILLAYRSLMNNVKGIAFSGGSYFPRDEMEQQLVDPAIRPYVKRMCDWLFDEFVMPARKMNLTEAEYSLLKILVFFVPVDGLSHGGKEVIRKAANFYRNILSKEILRNTASPEGVIERLSDVMSFLSVIETAKSLDDEGFSVMSLFNIADLKGKVTYEVHVGKGLKSSTKALM